MIIISIIIYHRHDSHRLRPHTRRYPLSYIVIYHYHRHHHRRRYCRHRHHHHRCHDLPLALLRFT